MAVGTMDGDGRPGAERQIRVLLAHRLDLLSRAMDSSIISQWLALDGACELTIWGPGLEGFVPGMQLDEAAELVDADVVLLPDYHHAIPGMWDELWAGAERCRRPVVWHLSDHTHPLALEQRRGVLARIRPQAVLVQASESALSDYRDLIDELGVRVLPVSWGFTQSIFHAPLAAAERDIDILLAGCDHEIYPTRARIKAAARRLAGEFTICDLNHPGYWEINTMQGRGQSHYADLLRRSRLTTTGSVNLTLPRKYWEAASCGAIAVGDLPDEAPSLERFRPAVLEVELTWDEERIAEEMRRLLLDEPRCEELRLAGYEATRDGDHAMRAHDYVSALRTVCRERDAPRRPRPFPSIRPTRLVCAAAEPESVPSLRADWTDVWHQGRPGLSRTRRAEAALDGDEDVVVIAFDPDAALEADALLLASACRRTGRLAVRPGVGSEAEAVASWSAVAAPRAQLRAVLGRHRGRAGLELALLELGRQLGCEVLPGAGYVDPAADLMRLVHQPAPAGVGRALIAAAQQQRVVAAMELAGLCALHGWGSALGSEIRPETVRPLQDPELELKAGAAFARYRPGVDADLDAICDHAGLGTFAPALHIGVPLSAGVAVESAFAQLADALRARGVDTDECGELIVLERPLFECELEWLGSELAAPGALVAPGASIDQPSADREVAYP